MSVMNSLPYRSPISKLLQFFRRSRDQWKAKCQEAKGENKSLKYRLAVMTESRNRWKAEARDSAMSPPKETRPAKEKPPKKPGPTPFPRTPQPRRAT